MNHHFEFLPFALSANTWLAASFRPRASVVACTHLILSLGCALPAAHASDSSSIATLPTVTVQAPLARDTQASISGWGSQPSWQTPLQALSIQAEALKQAQVQRLADLVKLDASTSDAYNTTGYWDSLSIRGYTLDNASNYRREGLPISAETRIGLENKSAVEIFKGTSGLQAGVSAPGGLVNLLVKRPEGRLRQAELAFTGGSSVKTSVDLGERFGTDQQFGLRVNAAVEKLAPDVQATQGHRRLTALAGRWDVSPDTRLDVEVEHSTHRQPSVPGFSAFGAVLPNAQGIDPAININQQAWTLPVDMRGQTGSIRWQQQWSTGWRSVVSYGEQRLQTDDRAAFPFGCGGTSCDRFYDDGSTDLYDFRSENEHRKTRAWQARLSGTAQVGSVTHDLTLGLMQYTFNKDVSTGPYNYVGTLSSLNPSTPFTPDPTPTYPSADVREKSTEWLLQDAMTFNNLWRAWAGVRHTRFDRSSHPTDGSASTQRVQGITTPWLALGYSLAPQTQVYTSWGEGAEVMTADRSPAISNPGEVMPAIKSKQWEIGIKQMRSNHQWGVTAFHIERPEMGEVGSRFDLDGHATHQGLEGHWQWDEATWGMSVSALLLKARRHGSVDVRINGLAPANVPKHTLKWSGHRQLPHTWTGSWPSTIQMDVVHEGPRWADRANTLRVSSWTRVDASIQTVQPLKNQAITWRLGVSNLLDTRAWKESPNSFGHIWLFPMAARTWTASVQIDF